MTHDRGDDDVIRKQCQIPIASEGREKTQNGDWWLAVQVAESTSMATQAGSG